LEFSFSQVQSRITFVLSNHEDKFPPKLRSPFFSLRAIANKFETMKRHIIPLPSCSVEVVLTKRGFVKVDGDHTTKKKRSYYQSLTKMASSSKRSRKVAAKPGAVVEAMDSLDIIPNEVQSPSKKVRMQNPDSPSSQGQKAAAALGLAIVTPGTNRHRAQQLAEEQAATKSNARRALFVAPGTRPVAVTPSRKQKQEHEEPKAKQKLIFGRLVTEIIVSDKVKQVYAIIRKLTGSIGGNGSHGPIYGELTMGSMQKMVNLMKEHTGFDTSSRFIDVGSGIGKPNLHVAQDPGVEFSYGIEVEVDRWVLGMNCLKGVLDAAYEQSAPSFDERILHRCIFEHADIRKAKTFDPFTHVYMFSIG